MSKALRLSEKWFRRGLWLVAFVFAWFLVGLGSTVVGDLPQVEQQRTLDDFLDPQRAPALKQAISQAQRSARAAQDALDQAELRQQADQASNNAARETFSNWLATRRATQQPEQDTELIARTAALDALRQAERRARDALGELQASARDAFESELRNLAPIPGCAFRRHGDDGADQCVLADRPSDADDCRPGIGGLRPSSPVPTRILAARLRSGSLARCVA